MPGGICLARSSLDGYCPPDQVEFIQENVLASLTDLFQAWLGKHRKNTFQILTFIYFFNIFLVLARKDSQRCPWCEQILPSKLKKIGNLQIVKLFYLPWNDRFLKKLKKPYFDYKDKFHINVKTGVKMLLFLKSVKVRIKKSWFLRMARLNASFVRLILIIGIVILLILTYKNYNSAIETLKNAEENILKEEEESRNYKENEKV